MLIGYITLASLVADFSPLTLITLLLFLPEYILYAVHIQNTTLFAKNTIKNCYSSLPPLCLFSKLYLASYPAFLILFFDMDAIYGGAIEWVETGTFASRYDYYYYFLNNLGGMSLLYIFFKLASYLGILREFFYSGFNRQQHSVIRMRHAHMFLNGQRAGRRETRFIYTRLFPCSPPLFMAFGFLPLIRFLLIFSQY